MDGAMKKLQHDSYDPAERDRVSAWLARSRPFFEPRPGYIRSGRTRLIKQISRVPQRSRLQAWFFRQRKVFQLAASLVLALCFLLNGTIINAAAQSAYPGELLYSIKRADENIKVATSVTPESEGSLRVEFVSRRALEIEDIVFTGRYEKIEAAAYDFEYQLGRALQLIMKLAQNDPSQAQVLAGELESTLEAQIVVLQLLVKMVPPAPQAWLEYILTASERGLQTLRDTPRQPHATPASP
jgi:hypothetical protein